MINPFLLPMVFVQLMEEMLKLTFEPEFLRFHSQMFGLASPATHMNLPRR